MSFTAHQIDIGQGRTILSGLDFKLPETGLISIIGRNGVGKSTLLRTLAGSLNPRAGEVLLHGRLLSSISISEKARSISFVPSAMEGVGAMTVLEYASLGRLPYLSIFSRFSKEDERIVSQSMAEMGISQFADRTLSQLSDGERQRVAICRAVVQRTPIILLDEPTSFLDVAARVEVLRMLSLLASRSLILFSTHDISLACQLSDRVMVLSKEEGVQIGTAEYLKSSGTLDSIFEGNGVSITYPDYGLRINESLNS